jgi:CO dehydrogenase/acetyl-CoA synthase beta subunit
MPKRLKEEVRERLEPQLAKMGLSDMFDKIATEDDAIEPAELVEYLARVEHPVLGMDPLF